MLDEIKWSLTREAQTLYVSGLVSNGCRQVGTFRLIDHLDSSHGAKGNGANFVSPELWMAAPIGDEYDP